MLLWKNRVFTRKGLFKKVFTALIIFIGLQARVFVTYTLFYPSLIFAGACQNGDPYKTLYTGRLLVLMQILDLDRSYCQWQTL
jgi:hypothetical protein